MIQKTIIIFLAFIASIGSISFIRAEEDKNDPFVSLLPEKSAQGTMAKPKAATPPPVTIEGAAWDTDMPQAIIDGEVYKVGDTLKNFDAKIYKIERNTVSIFYEGRLFEMKVAEKKEAK